MISFRPARRDEVAQSVALLRDDVLGQGREMDDLSHYLAAFDAMQAEGSTHLIVGKDLCITPIWPRKEGSACLGWRAGGTGPIMTRWIKTATFQSIATSKAPAGGQAGAARRCRRAEDNRTGARYAEVFGIDAAGAVVATYQLTLIRGLSLVAARRAQVESMRVATGCSRMSSGAPARAGVT